MSSPAFARRVSLDSVVGEISIPVGCLTFSLELEPHVSFSIILVQMLEPRMTSPSIINSGLSLSQRV